MGSKRSFYLQKNGAEKNTLKETADTILLIYIETIENFGMNDGDGGKDYVKG